MISGHSSEPVKGDRRPIKTRSQAWPKKLAVFFVNLGVTPNQMSVAGVLCAGCGAGALLGTTWIDGTLRSLLFVLAAVLVQLRLLSNMLDGLMAVECGKMTKTGILYNECPDRIADLFFLAGAGYACLATWGTALGWVAAVLAILTAYLRLLGGSCGLKQDFCGPFAKPQRMFGLTVSSLGTALEVYLNQTTWVLEAGLGIIIVGTFWTCIRRLNRIAKQLQER